LFICGGFQGPHPGALSQRGLGMRGASQSPSMSESLFKKYAISDYIYKCALK
jgi:hypothetical protein